MLGVPAPAKLNLFLRVIGRRADGYHELQTGFVAIGLADSLDFELLDDVRIERRGDLTGPPENDLVVRAAHLLKQQSRSRQGVKIDLRKRIPTGGGLGGGSSDAATTLLALNRLWRLHWERARLAELALQLGADVPFFLQPGPALGEGVGERLRPLALTPCWYALIDPHVAVSTSEIFRSRELTAHLEAFKIKGFPEGSLIAGGPSTAPGSADPDGGCAWRAFGNDLEPIVRHRFAQVDAALRYLSQFGDARMTGSGACVFAAFDTEAQARQAVDATPAGWSAWAVPGLSEHPLAPW